jgi:hypothetical protein
LPITSEPEKLRPVLLELSLSLTTMRKALLYVIYPVILFCIFPLIQYEVYKRTVENEDAATFWIAFRVLFSGPFLLLLGLFLILVYKERLHKILGIISVGIGCYWVYLIILALQSF